MRWTSPSRREDGPRIIFARKWAVTLENVQFFFLRNDEDHFMAGESDQTLFYLRRGQFSWAEKRYWLSHCCLGLIIYVTEKGISQRYFSQAAIGDPFSRSTLMLRKSFFLNTGSHLLLILSLTKLWHNLSIETYFYAFGPTFQIAAIRIFLPYCNNKQLKSKSN